MADLSAPQVQHSADAGAHIGGYTRGCLGFPRLQLKHD
jgi:hypothetical protein